MKKFKYRLSINMSNYLSLTIFEYVVRRITTYTVRGNHKPKFIRNNCIEHNTFTIHMKYVYK
jgi:hypothetical protein